MKSRTIFLLSLSLSCIFLSHSLFAQTVAWTDTYNGTTENEDRGNAAVLDATGNLYTTGYSFRADNGRDIVAVKYTPTGSVSWQRTFNTGSDNTDEGKAIALDANGNVFVAGLGDRNMLLLKLSPAGDTLWSRQWNGAANGFDEANSIVIDPSGNIIIGGKSDSDASTVTNYDYAIAKYNTSGTLLWSQTYNGTGNAEDLVNDLGVDASGNIYVTGSSFGTNGDEDILTVKYNSSGVVQFNKRIDSGNGQDIAYHIEVVGNNFYLCGEYASTTSDDDYVTIKYDLAGTVVWSKLYNGLQDDRASEIKVDASGNVFVSGRSESAATAIYNVVTIKYNSAGTQQWLHSYDNAGKEDRPYDMAIDANGNCYLAGKTVTYTPTDSIGDVLTFKISATGTTAWAQIYAEVGNDNDEGRNIVIDASGNVYTTGFGYSTTQNDLLVIKYNNSGTQQWFARYNGQGDNTDKYRRIITDAQGNVYAVGYSFNTDQARDMLITKYNANGTLAWTNTYNSIPNDNPMDEANDVGVDATGNVYVAGTTDENFALLKYNAAGVFQWIQTYNNAADEFDEAIALYIDAAGGVYVTGRTDVDASSNSNYNIVTAKYNSSGIQQWAQIYNGAANGSDRPEAMTGDANGVYITGRSVVGATENILTLKYSLTGTQAWTANYGTTTGDDRGDAIAVLNGIVVVGGRTSANGIDDAVTIRYNATGTQQWAQVYSNIGNDRIYDIAIDSLGMVYVAGQNNDGVDDNVLVIKYNGAGVQQWQRIYDSGTGFDQANAIGVDCAGNVWITGRSEPNAGNDNYLVMKLKGKDGAILWSDSYDALNLNLFDDSGEDIAVFSASNTNHIYTAGFVTTATQADATVRKCTETVPSLVISPANPSVCANNPLVLSVSGATLGTFRWKDGNTVLATDTTVTVTPTTVGTKNYTLQWNSGSCSATINVPVVVDASPTPAITGATAVCTGAPYTYTYSVTPVAGNTYLWTVSSGGTIIGSNTGASITVQWSSGTVGTVSITQTNP